MKRIVIIGTTGSGKTTLGKQISERLHVPEYAYLNIVHLHSQRETDEWLAQLTPDH